MIRNFELKRAGAVYALIYAAVLVPLYYSSHRVMIKWWGREDYNYCYLIPFIVLYLIWEKRDALKRVPAGPSCWKGLFPLVVGVFLFWLGELGGEFYMLYLSSWFVVLGLCWLHLGWQKLKVILFPIAFILTMFPPPNLIYFNLSLKLKLISSRIGVWLLQLAGKTAYREGNVIDLGFTQLQVVDACSGSALPVPFDRTGDSRFLFLQDRLVEKGNYCALRHSHLDYCQRPEDSLGWPAVSHMGPAGGGRFFSRPFRTGYIFNFAGLFVF